MSWKAIEERIVRSLKKETGIRLTASETIRVANMLRIKVPLDGARISREFSKPNKQEPVDVYIRWLIERDLKEVMEIDRRSFPDPWTKELYWDGCGVSGKGYWVHDL